MESNPPALEALLRASPFAWWEWDLESNEVSFNDQKATMLGYNPETLRGKGYQAFTDLVHEDDYGPTMGAMQAVLTGAMAIYQIDYRIRAIDGTYHWYMDRGYVLERRPDGRPRKLRGLVIDLGHEGQQAGGPEVVADIVRQSFYPTSSGGESVLVVCSVCRRVKRNKQQYVSLSPELEHLLAEKTSHGLCPDCFRTLYPEYAGKILGGA